MAEIVVKVSKEVERVMKEHPAIDWSGVAEKAIKERITKLQLFDTIASESRLTEKDALKLGRKINRALWDKHYKKLV
ncbi:MAG: hypothetical protein J7L44_00165 [Candidatus Diapherotrites archaeon]|nr:hypothetical protein [Candidatus Diapherotrites archaeon]